jgi:hypothetical protein
LKNRGSDGTRIARKRTGCAASQRRLKPEIAEKPRSSGAAAPDFPQRPAIAGLFSRIYPTLEIVGGLIPRRADFSSGLNL